MQPLNTLYLIWIFFALLWIYFYDLFYDQGFQTLMFNKNVNVFVFLSIFMVII